MQLVPSRDITANVQDIGDTEVPNFAAQQSFDFIKMKLFGSFGVAAVFFGLVFVSYIVIISTTFGVEALVTQRQNTAISEAEIKLAIENEKKRDAERKRTQNKATPPSPDDEVLYNECEYIEDWGHYSRESVTRENWKTPDFIYSKTTKELDGDISEALSKLSKATLDAATDDACTPSLIRLSATRRSYSYYVTKQVYSFISLRVYISGMVLNRRSTSTLPRLLLRVVTPEYDGDAFGGVYEMTTHESSSPPTPVYLVPPEDAFSYTAGSSRFAVRNAIVSFVGAKSDGVVVNRGDVLQLFLDGADEIFVTSFSCIFPKNGCMTYDPTGPSANDVDIEEPDDTKMQVFCA